jgi:pyruvate kinase
MKTKIIATIGPSSLNYKILENMKKNGMDICRINTKHGNEKQWEEIYKNVKKLKFRILFDINNLEKIEWIKKHEFDYLAVSYTKNKAHLKKIKKLFLPKRIKVISKIETHDGIANIDGIIDESFGVMVARGDLSKNISYEKVPIEQKLIIKKCNAKKKFVITATEMLLSIVNSKSPERSEISDIANAVIDGSNAVMLSEETAIGKYPALALKIMNKTIKYTEKNMNKIK